MYIYIVSLGHAYIYIDVLPISQIDRLFRKPRFRRQSICGRK